MPNAPRIAKDALKSDLAYELVADLVATIGPRFAGTAEEAAARDWAVEKFEELGFKNIHVEEFEVPGWRRGREEGSISSPIHHPLTLSTLGGSPATPTGGLMAPVVLVESYDALLQIQPGALEDKIVFINGRMDLKKTGEGFGAASKKRKFGAIEAGRRGAVAVLSRSLNTSADQIASTGSQWFHRDFSPIPAAALSNPDADYLESLLRDEPTVEVELFLEPRDLGPQISGNVIAEIPGATRPEELVLLAAHLDTWDNTPGALDDGSGVAIVMSAAYLVSQQETAPDRTIRVVLFGAEEIGALGGFAYANRHGPSFLDMARSIEDETDGARAWAPPLDQLTTLSGFAPHANPAPYFSAYRIAIEADSGSGYPLNFKTRVNIDEHWHYHNIGKAMGTIGVDTGPNTSGAGSDIYAFLKSGKNVASIEHDMDTYFESYHTENDTLDKVDPEALKRSVAAYAIFAQCAASESVQCVNE